jgi:hypothetical protein
MIDWHQGDSCIENLNRSSPQPFAFHCDSLSNTGEARPWIGKKYRYIRFSSTSRVLHGVEASR